MKLKEKLIQRGLIFASIALLSAGLLLAATATTADPAYVRTGHFSPDTPAVDIYINGLLYAGGVGYGSMAEWREVTSGAAQVTVYAAGTVTNPLITAEVILAPGQAYLVGPTNVKEKLQIIHMPIYNNAIAASDARVEVIHLMAESSRIQFNVGNSTIVKALGWVEDPLVADLPAGDYQVTSLTEDGTASLYSQALSLNGGANYTFVIAGPSPLKVITLVTRPGNPVTGQ